MVSIEDIYTEYFGNAKFIAVSLTGIKAGDLIYFDYDNSSRLGLVVKSQRTGIKGHFLSTQDNTLLNVFVLESLTSGMFEIIINNLYRNRVRATYKNTPRLLGVFMGKDNFRTFNAARIKNLYNIILPKR